jgi:hypothetical protein
MNNNAPTNTFRRYRQISAEVSVALKEMGIDRQYSFSLYYLNAGDTLTPSDLYYCDTFVTMRELEARVMESFQGDPKLRGRYIAVINSKFMFEYEKLNNQIISKII